MIRSIASGSKYINGKLLYLEFSNNVISDARKSPWVDGECTPEQHVISRDELKKLIEFLDKKFEKNLFLEKCFTVA
jgi:hypothetical protein